MLVAFVTLQTVLAAFAWSATRAPTYQASAQVLVTPIQEFDRTLPQLPLVRESSDRTRVIETAANLLDSPAAASLTAARLGPGWTARRVDAMVDVLPQGGSDVLAVTAKADDARLAARVADEYARSALDARARAFSPILASRIAEVERQLRAQPDASSPLASSLAEQLASLRALEASNGDPTLALLAEADVPSSPVGPSRSLLALLSVFAGLAVAIGAALVMDMLGSPRVADAAEAVAVTGLPVLARVPGLTLWQRARGTSPVRFRPTAAGALRTLQHQLELEAGTRRLLLVGAAAGDGVTTSVAELGLTLARAGHDVLLVDLNTQNPELASRLGLSQPASLSALLASGEEWEAGIASVPGVHGLKLLAMGAQGALGIPDDVAADLPEILASARDRFDYVLVDAPPAAESAEALRIASAVDAVVLVVRPARTELPKLEAALDLLERAQRRPQGLLLVGGRAPAAPADRAPVGLRTEPSGSSGAVARAVQDLITPGGPSGGGVAATALPAFNGVMRARTWVDAVRSVMMPPALVAALTAIMVLCYLALLLDDGATTWLIREDHPIEMGGALALLAASIGCLALWRRVRGDARWSLVRQLSLLALAALFFFGFGEELSWGERIFGFAPPESVAKANHQHEFNVHNLSLFSGEFDPDHLFQLFWFAFGVVVPLVALWSPARRVLQRFLPILPAALAPLFVLNQVLTRGFHELFTRDPSLYHSSVFDPSHSIFEVKETVASLLLAAGFWQLVSTWRRERSPVRT